MGSRLAGRAPQHLKCKFLLAQTLKIDDTQTRQVERFYTISKNRTLQDSIRI
jgi:hypothetical protein